MNASPAVCPIESMRLMARHVGEGILYVGTLHLTSGCHTRYQDLDDPLLCWNDGAPWLSQSLVGTPCAAGDGIANWVRAPIWARTRDSAFLHVRLLPVFQPQLGHLGQNGYVVFAASLDEAPAAFEFGSDGHAWCEKTGDGAMQPMSPPFDARGMAISQALTNEADWPDRDGIPHVVPALDGAAREAAHRRSLLLARYGRAEIDKAALREQLRQDPLIMAMSMHAYGDYEDEYYPRYLAALQAAGGLRRCEALTAPRAVELDALARACLHSVMVDASTRSIEHGAVISP